MRKATAEAQDYAEKVLRFPAATAKILKDTFLFKGEEAGTSDDMALMQIRDLIDEIDPNLFRQKRKALVTDQSDES